MEGSFKLSDKQKKVIRKALGIHTLVDHVPKEDVEDDQIRVGSITWKNKTLANMH